MVFGSDYPLLTPERWIDDFRSVAPDATVLPAILKENAATLLGLR